MAVNTTPLGDHDKSVNWSLWWLWGQRTVAILLSFLPTLAPYWSLCSHTVFLPSASQDMPPSGSLPGLTLPAHNLLTLLLKVSSQSEAIGPLGCGPGGESSPGLLIPRCAYTTTNRDSVLFMSVLLFFSQEYGDE